MANIARLRVEARWGHGSSDYEKQKIGYSVIKAFKKAYDKSGIAREYKDHAFYVKPSERKRRKKQQQLRKLALGVREDDQWLDSPKQNW